jgi:processive 1,2-diacylglycerol beta-glucosyltransferase
MKILFLPLFKMPSGHHRVADALISLIRNKTDKIECKKVDILSYSSPFLEMVVTDIYLKWIRHIPETYDWAYKHFAYTKSHTHRSFKGLEPFFLNRLQKLLDIEQPDVVVCTHGFPSLLMSRLKTRGLSEIPVINVYTDFFVNDIWGREGINYHFVPTQEVRDRLVNEYQLDESSILVTGIPVHPTFLKRSKASENPSRTTILVAGGSSGLGNMAGLMQKTNPEAGIHYRILCGKNKALYEQIIGLNLDHVEAFPYISSREEMNEMYDQADAIVTKPGGVTMSEVFHKKLPVFVHSALPGQEYINLQILKEKGLVQEVKSGDKLEAQLVSFLENEVRQERWKKAVANYLKETAQSQMMASLIFSLLNSGTSLKTQRSKGRFKPFKKFGKKVTPTPHI